MGNRAVITTKEKKIGVYVHWNGGRDSISAFLKFCKLSNFRTPETDSYGWARLVQVIASFFSDNNGGLSVGIDTFENTDFDNYDNGTYIIENWEIVGREFFNGIEQNEYTENEILIEINKRMPPEMKLSEEILNKN